MIGHLPHKPRLYLVNKSLGFFDDRANYSPCGNVELPKLAEGQSVRLRLVPRSGCKNEINHVTVEGDELLRLIELGQRGGPTSR